MTRSAGRPCVGFRARLAAAAAVVATGVAAVQAGSPDAGAVFESRRSELLVEGVRSVDGFVFSCVRLPIPEGASERSVDMVRGKAGVQAIRRMLERQVGERALSGIPAGPLRDALLDGAMGCLGESTDLRGMQTVHSAAEGGFAVVVRSVPEERIAGLGVDRAGLVECLAARVSSGKARAIDPLLIEELAGTDESGPDRRARLVSALAQILGPGIELSAGGRWTTADRAVCPGCIAGWTSAAAEAAASSRGCGAALSPLPAAVSRRLGLEELLQIAAVRANDPSILGALNERLAADGFVRSAALLRFPAEARASFEDRPGNALDATARSRIFASPVVVALLLTDGGLDAAWGPAPACLADATAAFDEGTPDSVSRSIALLCDGMGAVPNADALSLLSAALLASDEARLAEPLARAAFVAMPTHKFAGVNALRAQRALGMKERAAQLFPGVAAEAQVGSWGRRQLESIAEWLGVPLPPPPPSPPGPRGAAGDR